MQPLHKSLTLVPRQHDWPAPPLEQQGGCGAGELQSAAAPWPWRTQRWAGSRGRMGHLFPQTSDIRHQHSHESAPLYRGTLPGSGQHTFCARACVFVFADRLGAHHTSETNERFKTDPPPPPLSRQAWVERGHNTTALRAALSHTMPRRLDRYKRYKRHKRHKRHERYKRHNRQQQCAKALTCAPRPMCPGVRRGPVEVLGGRVLLRHRCRCRADGHEGLRHTASTNATTGWGAPRLTAPARACAAWAGGWRRATPGGGSQSYGGGPTAQSLARHARGVHGRCGYRRL